MESKIQENGDLHQNFIYNSLSYDGYERFHDEVMENVSVSIQCSEYQEIGTSTLNLNSHKEKMKISLSQEQLQLNNDGRSCLTVPSSASRKIRSTESLGNSRSESTKLVKLEFQQPIVTKETSKLIAEDNFITVTPPQDSANDNEVIYAIPTKGIHDLSKETPYNLINEKNEIKTSSASLTPLKSSKIAPTSIASTTEFNQDVKYSFSFYCSLCNNIFNDPRTLDCLHSFCVECLARLDASNDLENNQFWRKISDHSDLSCKK
ncbi:CLUMA_CG001300, isoform A [Clunio marinus]|uniref:CLUMA_CG001300, isoform A n=1 Tax=Clunio marinus TaxID=568069 RepID=A0A1J1HHX8_9DIPT|nr:CLUMA_CG001300, isoform A [Clunio marinus]